MGPRESEFAANCELLKMIPAQYSQLFIVLGEAVWRLLRCPAIRAAGHAVYDLIVRFPEPNPALLVSCPDIATHL